MSVSNSLRHARAREEQLWWHSQRQGSGPSSPQINVTPLIDVLLVLIIVFMIVVAQQQTTGERAQIPQPARDQLQTPARTIVIQVIWSGKSRRP